MRAAGGVLVLLSLGIAGCVGPDPAGTQGAQIPDAGEDRNPRPVVIAIVDTGIAPYHEFFERTYNENSVTSFLRTLEKAHVPVQTIDPTLGGENITFDSRYETDKTMWQSLSNETLYHISGTNLFGYSMPSTYDPEFPESFLSPREEIPVFDEQGHGTTVSYVASASAPDAVIVVVKIPNSYVSNHDEVARLSALAFHWLAEQSWVDIVSYSFGIRANLPNPWDPEIAGGIGHLDLRGKLFFTGSGNEPSSTITSGAHGPSSAISVGGAHNASHGDRPDTGKQMDYVSDYVMWIIDSHSRAGWEWNSGTSLSAPYVAGTAASIMAELREDEASGGESSSPGQRPSSMFTARDIRRALNLTARYWMPTEWDQQLTDVRDPFGQAYNAFSAPILPTPWLQMGWGYVGPEIVPQAVAYLKGEYTPPPKPAEAVQYMETTYALREAYWSNRPL